MTNRAPTPLPGHNALRMPAERGWESAPTVSGAGMPGPQPSVAIADGLTISRVGLGCSGLMRLASKRRRRDHIAAAIDAGVTHFDVARLYGLGAAERELGAALRGRRDEVTVATKFGIDTSAALSRLAPLQAPVRLVMARSAKAVGFAREREGKFVAPRRYDASKARLSLDKSLRELGFDHVDILFLHDPRPQDDVDVESLAEFLATARAAGKIRTWGVSLDDESGLEVCNRMSDPGVVQLSQSLLLQSPAERRVIAFGLMADSDRIAAWLRSHPGDARRWTESLGRDPQEPGILAGLIIGAALARPETMAALCETSEQDELIAATGLLDRSSDELIQRFADCMLRDRGRILETAVR